MNLTLDNVIGSVIVRCSNLRLDLLGIKLVALATGTILKAFHRPVY